MKAFVVLNPRSGGLASTDFERSRAKLAGSEIPLAILPLGTFNHFARDLAIPPDLPAAVAAIARVHVSVVDIGEVNGRVFVNNSALGIYPHLAALLWLALRAVPGRLQPGCDFTLARLPAVEIRSRRHRLRVALDGESVMPRPPLRYRIRSRALRVIVPATDAR